MRVTHAHMSARTGCSKRGGRRAYSFSMPWMILMTARSDRFGVSALLSIFLLVIGLVSCEASHFSMAERSYVQPDSNSTRVDSFVTLCK